MPEVTRRLVNDIRTLTDTPIRYVVNTHFEHVIARHGDPFAGRETIDHFQAFLRDLWRQANALHEQKVPVADAARRIGSDRIPRRTTTTS